MRELRRGQIKKIIKESMRLASEITLRNELTLEDLYKVAEAVKGEKLTRREKQIIAGIVRRNYPSKNEVRKSKSQILIVL